MKRSHRKNNRRNQRKKKLKPLLPVQLLPLAEAKRGGRGLNVSSLIHQKWLTCRKEGRKKGEKNRKGEEKEGQDAGKREEENLSVNQHHLRRAAAACKR